MLLKGKELEVVICSWTKCVEVVTHFHLVVESYLHNVDHVHTEGMDLCHMPEIGFRQLGMN
jgi:hypothetical protein